MAATFKALMAELRWRGLWGTVRAIKMNKMGTMQCFVGEDKFKNRFFENKNETYGRDRWVEYVDDRNPDSLKITPEWHAWLHHNVDEPPTDHPLPKPIYQAEETGNPTGTREAYVPPHHKLAKNSVGSASEKYESWRPGSEAADTEVDDRKDVLDLK
ncbi:NADH dehydrogenase [ubiquinone] 1 alpha subcomplex subunit 12 [Gracilariopsis chorda]|uniref:NADH dehydrogenase [ubiquinone] 1 alpha subcomplex subunit 12 n=1 Tax=Gracilariopsis chorda TaxID=448386 RepID=A0A2V3IMD8_9FLOR|nr:NADH dehydrogenase [ubiquinone] 1 alpha subcomplex subunit 12 [Gracilariopsis chorda]|eukprot:PXF43217.1 NADH dehydrogenase [ubiquinone] 1 alpha subcomplex subunit 12 [Gracilariopsis chorda]